MTSKITDHEARAVERLPRPLSGKPKIEKFVGAHNGEVQPVEDALFDLLSGFDIDTAIGKQLDFRGKLVGEFREGASDDDYRRRVRARIRTNRSKGRRVDLIRIARLIVNDSGATIECENQYPAALVMRIKGITITSTTASTLVSFLRQAVSAGVRIILEYFLSDRADLFSFAGSTNGEGFGDEADGAVGGKFATAAE